MGGELAEKARSYEAAAQRLHAALHRHHDKLRQLQFATARFESQLAEGRDVPAEGWDAEAPSAGADRVRDAHGGLKHAASPQTAASTEAAVRRLVELYASSSEHPAVAMAKVRSKFAAKRDAAPPANGLALSGARHGYGSPPRRANGAAGASPTKGMRPR